MPRHALSVAAACLVLLGGFAAALDASGAERATAVGTTTASPTTASPTTASPTTASSTTASSTTLPAPSVVVFSGHGWGHGLGLSQWGAYGYARHGWTYDRILSHYYTGTTLGPAKVAAVRVLLLQAKKTTLASTAPWSVTDAAGTKAPLDPAAALVLKPTLAIDGHPDLRPPFTFRSKQPLSVGGRLFRGTLVASSAGKRVSVVDVVGLEAYLKGVVPAEMPSGWPAEALKAQAVAARSYALANLAKGQPFDLYGDTRDQVYGGVGAESPPASDAVEATKGQVLLYGGKVADALFFSTSGGRTASALESTGVAVPYLVPVADPYDTASPYHDWGPVLFDGAAVARLLKLSSPIADLEPTNGPSGRVKSVTVVGDDESRVTLTGNAVRGALELRSTWFTPALLRLAPVAKTMTWGGAVSLTGSVHGADTVSLESAPLEAASPAAKPAHSPAWAAAGDLILDGSGAFSTVVKPQVGTQYRLVWGAVRAGLAKISVAPRVDAAFSAGALQGRIRPAVAAAPVQLQQQAGAGWTTVSSTVTDAAGSWSFAGAPSAGTYRVRCAPGHGLAAGLSTSIVVP